MTRPLLLRADASHTIGFGHVARCLALAEAWPGEVHLRTSALPAAWVATAEARGATVHRIEDEPGGSGEPGGPADADATARIVRDTGAVAVIDGAHFGAAFRRRVLAEGPVCLLDDDGTDEPLDATWVLNQNLAAQRSWYPAAGATEVLAGPAYALLRPGFAATANESAAATTTQTGPAGAADAAAGRARIVLTFGGSDPAGWTARLLDHLDHLEGDAAAAPAWRVDGPRLELVIGAGARDAATLVRRAGALGVRVHHDPPSMAGVLAGATVAVAAAGTTVLELGCLGVPAVLVVVAPNQEVVVRGAVDAGIAVAPPASPAGLLDAAVGLAADPDRCAAMARRGRSLVDGRGAHRVAQILAAR
jgi:UDP-2,4-diacetamido-2,4,6-trideoxy-beta-L-altropyranose hydrolase